MLIYTQIPTKKPKKKRKKPQIVAKRRSTHRPFKEMKTDPYAHLSSNKGSSVILDGHSTGKIEPLHYTGDKLLGISIVHKSCLQPVFSEQEAKDFSSMRR